MINHLHVLVNYVSLKIIACLEIQYKYQNSWREKDFWRKYSRSNNCNFFMFHHFLNFDFQHNLPKMDYLRRICSRGGSFSFFLLGWGSSISGSPEPELVHGSPVLLELPLSEDRDETTNLGLISCLSFRIS